MTSASSELRVSDLMSQVVHTLTPTQSLPLAESMMRLHHVRHIPVVDEEGQVVGLLTHRDVLSAKLSSLTPLSEDERSSLQLAVPVSRVMRAPVWTIEPHALAVAAARIMRDHRFGCLPVVDEGRLIGILTETDLLALVTDSLALDRPAPPWTIARVMTPAPVTITPTTTMADARAAMTRYGIRHLPVVDGGTPVSIVCERDLGVAETIFEETKQTSAAHVVRLLGSGQGHQVAPDARLDLVLREMFHGRLDAVLVVEKGKLLGIFTALDACRLLSEACTPPRATV